MTNGAASSGGESTEEVATPGGLTPMTRKQRLILKEVPKKPKKRVAEVAGGTAAECAAVVCCCPCGLINLLVLTMVKLPAGLFRRAVRRRKKRRSASNRKNKKPPGSVDTESKPSASNTHVASTLPAEKPLPWPEKSPVAEVSEMENEMWPQFSGAGFWRSPSQRE
ncbi:hypothetical protein HPP92_028255 [Vanilla planifolia]|uniref:Pollen preferential protein n=1 Tax=Vanilla planifolia TaxID=51239 RepID=A0A835U428_VANPL|nr:hypothetical protein HPP92_028255 [Vanilla planifolia]